MAFIKVKDIKSKEEAIINTDTICRIEKNPYLDAYSVFFSYGEFNNIYLTKYTCFDYEIEEAEKIFSAIGVRLD